MTKITLTAGHVLATTVMLQPDQQKEAVPRMRKRGRAQVWKKKTSGFFKQAKEGWWCHNLTSALVANSYTCLFCTTGLDSVSEKKQHPIERLLGIRQLQVDVFAQPTSASQRCLFLAMWATTKRKPLTFHEPWAILIGSSSRILGSWPMKYMKKSLFSWAGVHPLFCRNNPGQLVTKPHGITLRNSMEMGV